jgi:hypothetical protein
VFADLLNLGNLSAQLVQGIPSSFSACSTKSLLEQPACYADVSNTGLSRGFLIISSLSYDITQYGSELAKASEEIVKCGIQEVEEAAKKFASIGQTVESCVLTGPPSA